MANRYHQGKFIPRNPQKYVGDVNNIIYRSSYEFHFMRFLDNSDNIIRWNSEDVVVPYYNPMDGETHRYFVDFYIEYKKKDGTVSRELIEIKPKVQCYPPKQPKRKTKKSIQNYNEAVRTFVKNKMKWGYAEKFARDNGMIFRVMNEDDLGIKRR